jgi:hypothetical protein
MTTIGVFLLVTRSPVDRHSGSLVLYSFSDTDPQYRDNLRYFVRHGVLPGTDYVFVLNGATPFTLPELPGNARYLRHDNVCYDWGSYGWALDRIEGWNRYRRYFFVNSSVRGPFTPVYSKRAWTDYMASMLSARVKLAGSTINCENGPHVQSYAVATDVIGLEVMRDAGVFVCRKTLADVIQRSELEASKAILAAGYSIDSLMARYAGVDWTDPKNWRCNGQKNPTQALGNAGVSVSPMEVMFVKVKDRYVNLYRWTNALEAVAYDAVPDVNGGTRPARVVNQSRACFDARYYMLENPDLPQAWSAATAFAHFQKSGRSEGRPARFACKT